MSDVNAPVLPHAPLEQPRLRVLLVDDTSQVLHDLRQLLELAGNMEIVAEAGNGLEAVQLTARLLPDVVVMDLEMPVMNGYEATRQIKFQFPATRVVILSVHAGPMERESARAAGADVFVVKGAGYDVLVNAIQASENTSSLLDPKKGDNT
jgi:DNA-binding NarL/FixJ family response regulator